ncbi:hypothetical protein AXG93_146s1330 [Marchantia polymorpha subsp. ruderalis]|uniref:Uncharacterized protein n=1 Tax=Marchantia polymorpha subsp. ruderalis TaxID=1480154 RepID=A0A176WAB2_MARPO|nr:hypothetical protein AXG93_146s1330 [Marchantia polymorpha subsp. ruderalis]
MEATATGRMFINPWILCPLSYFGCSQPRPNVDLLIDVYEHNSSSCKECEPTFVFENTSSPKMVYSPVVVTAKAAGIVAVEASVADIGQ